MRTKLALLAGLAAAVNAATDVRPTQVAVVPEGPIIEQPPINQLPENSDRMAGTFFKQTLASPMEESWKEKYPNHINFLYKFQSSPEDRAILDKAKNGKPLSQEEQLIYRRIEEAYTMDRESRTQSYDNWMIASAIGILVTMGVIVAGDLCYSDNEWNMYRR